jgi:hypothetical protein
MCFKVDFAHIPSQRSWILRFRPDVLVNRPDAYQSSNIRPDDLVIPSVLPSKSRSFELFKVTSVQTSQQHVRTPFNVRQEKGFPSQTQIWEDSCNRPDDKSTLSGRYPWWGKTWRRFATVRTTGLHHPDASLLIMEIACNRSATI